MVKVTLVRSHIGLPQKQRRVLDSLGLRKVGETTVKADSPSLRGMIHKVSHLVRVAEE